VIIAATASFVLRRHWRSSRRRRCAGRDCSFLTNPAVCRPLNRGALVIELDDREEPNGRATGTARFTRMQERHRPRSPGADACSSSRASVLELAPKSSLPIDGPH
jgi:hypothetical protein